jgi:hypothetical protein
VEIKILVQNMKRFQKLFDIRKITKYFVEKHDHIYVHSTVRMQYRKVTNYLVEKHHHIYVQSTVRVCNEKRHIELNLSCSNSS